MNRLHLYLFSLLIIGCFSVQAQPLTVYPGDCNNNGICNNVDLLYIGIGFNATGPPRNVQGINWSPAGISGVQPWQQFTATGVNYGHIDCDGSGSIGNQQDLDAITMNYGLFHGTIMPDPYGVGVQGDPLMGMQVTMDSVVGGDTVYIQVNLGTPFLAVDSLYGLAFSMTYDTSLVDTIFGDFRSGWMATGGITLLTMEKDLRDSGRIDFGVTRIDGANAAGFGVIGSIGIVMDDNLKTAAAVEELELNFDRILGITRSEQPIPFRAQRDTLYILSDREKPFPPSQVSLYPNPAQEYLMINTSLLRMESIEMINATGQTVLSQQVNNVTRLRLPLTHLRSGLYWARIRTDQGTLTKKILINQNKN